MLVWGKSEMSGELGMRKAGPSAPHRGVGCLRTSRGPELGEGVPSLGTSRPLHAEPGDAVHPVLSKTLQFQSGSRQLARHE